MTRDVASECTVLADRLHDVGQWFLLGSDWPLVAPAPRRDWMDVLTHTREELTALLGQCTRPQAEAVLRSHLFNDPALPAVCGLAFERTPVTEARLASAREVLAHGWSHPLAPQAFIMAVLHAQPFELPLMPDWHACAEHVLDRYLGWLFARPLFRTTHDDARYVAWLTTLLTQVRSQLDDRAMRPHLGLLVQTLIQRLDIGMIVHADVSIRAVLDARAALVEQLTATIESLRGTRVGGLPPRSARPRIRLGILLRTLMRHPDPLAFCSQFEHFDPDRYEIIVYSQDLVDRQCEHDIALYQRLFRFVHRIHTLNGRSVRQMIDRIQDDDLDVFVYSYAATIGVSPVELLVSAPLARVQVLMNSYVPLSTGFRSFTHVATVEPPPASRDTLLGECRESLAVIPRVLLSYLPAESQVPERPITRAQLSIPDDAVVLYNGGAVDKLVPRLLDAWVRALARIPGAFLVLAPFNPGWSGTRGAPALFRALDDACRTHRVDRRRVIVLRELSPRDTAQLYAMATVYLGTFPHGSSTSVALAMQALVPCVTRRSPWLRGTGDASIVQSIGLDELVADDADAYVDLTVQLATDQAAHTAVRERIRAALPSAPFLASAAYGKALQGMFDTLAAEQLGLTH